MIPLESSMRAGTEWLVDAQGCSPELLRDVATISRICEQIILDLDLRVLGESRWHEFAHPGGVTGMFLLTESHLACHTYPELGVATFNLYCCRQRPEWPWEQRLIDALQASAVTVTVVLRGEAGGRGTGHFDIDRVKREISAQEVRKQ